MQMGGRRSRLLTVPLWAFSVAVTVLRRLPRYRLWSSAMAERVWNTQMAGLEVDRVRRARLLWPVAR